MTRYEARAHAIRQATRLFRRPVLYPEYRLWLPRIRLDRNVDSAAGSPITALGPPGLWSRHFLVLAPGGRASPWDTARVAVRLLGRTWGSDALEPIDQARRRSLIANAVNLRCDSKFDREAYLNARVILALLIEGLEGCFADCSCVRLSDPVLEALWRSELNAYRAMDLFLARQASFVIRR